MRYCYVCIIISRKDSHILVGIEIADLSATIHQFGSREQHKEKTTADRVLFAQSMVACALVCGWSLPYTQLNSMYNHLASYAQDVTDNTGTMRTPTSISLRGYVFISYRKVCKDRSPVCPGEVVSYV